MPGSSWNYNLKLIYSERLILKAMAKKKKDDSSKKKAKVHKDIEGFEIKINPLGEITSNYDIDQLNEFLNKNVQDKKLVGRDDLDLGDDDDFHVEENGDEEESEEEFISKTKKTSAEDDDEEDLDEDADDDDDEPLKPKPKPKKK